MTIPPPIAPERLDRELDRVGRLLRAADPAFRAPLDEAKAFSALDARRRGTRPTPLLLGSSTGPERK